MTLTIRSFQNTLKLLFATYLLLSAHLVTAATDQEKAMQAPIDELHNALINNMKTADSSSFNDRYAQMERVITNTFDTPLISRVVLSRYWKSLDEKAQTDFIDIFNRLTISTYVSRFDSYNNESFKHIAIEAMKKDRYLIKTEMLQTDDEPVSFNYIVQNDNGKWKIISVIANGINDLSLKRSEYSSVIKDQGYEALVKSIEQKISDLQPKTGQ
jgi:phospholipid transport system substrate-binding protein